MVISNRNDYLNYRINKGIQRVGLTMSKLELTDDEQTKVMAKMGAIRDERYEKAYHILMEYWDSFDNEQKVQIDKELTRLKL